MGELRDSIADGAAKRSKEFLKQLGAVIEVTVAPCVGYVEVLKGEHQPPFELNELIDLALRKGRVIVCGRGASGKTALAHRSVVRAAERRIAPFLIDLARWDQATTLEWQVIKGSPREALTMLLSRFAQGGFDMADVEFLPPDVDKLFIVDGLNETPGSVADEILAACDQIASMVVGASAIVTDRIVRRNLDHESRWRFAMPLPVAEAEAGRLTAKVSVPAEARSLLTSPFFVDKAMRGELRNSPLETIRDLVERRGKVDEAGLKVAAQVAFRAYEFDRSRTFNVVRFAEAGRKDVADTLMAGGILLPAGDMRVAFMHHWIHDYLASKFVTTVPELWDFDKRHATLDALTFGANSFDAVAFCLELLAEEQRGEFLQAVYDWNPYAAGYALSEANVGLEEVPREIRIVILAMLAEKRFDRHFYSARRASDALDLLSDEDARSLRSTKSLEDLISRIVAIDLPGEDFAAWRELFAATPGSRASDSMIAALGDENSVTGWAAANVLKRLELSEDQKKQIILIADHKREVVRWRAVHVMGGFTDTEFVAKLFERLENDANENVKYGAVRSLIEVASRGEDVLRKIVDGIIERLELIKGSSKLTGELTKAAFLAEGMAPTDWAQEISRVFYELMERADDPTDVERWSKVASRLRVHHRIAGRLAA